MVIQGTSRPPSRDRLTQADQAELLARWPNGAVVEVETATNPHLNCFIATDDSGIHRFLFWRELDGRYVREQTRTGLKRSGSSVQELMPLVSPTRPGR
jgi:hypothetical protein